MKRANRKVSSGATVRRSVALPRRLVQAAVDAAPTALRANFNRLVIVALQEYVARRREEAFAESMATMASDPQIRKLSLEMERAFRKAVRDGLRD